MKPVILHIPHSSRRIPTEIRDQFLLSKDDLELELNLMTDHYTDEIFKCDGIDGISSVVYPVSRLVVDPERFIYNDLEIMSGVGMGVIYEKTSSGEPLRMKLSDGERSSLIDTYYHPHHTRTTDAVSKAVSATGKCLIIDCHSFPERPLPYELDQDSDRPDFCIGTDEFHTPQKVLDKMVENFSSLGYKVAINRPFSGSYVPMVYYQKNKNVMSIMIEVNRDLYIDEQTLDKKPLFITIKTQICQLMEILQNEIFHEL